MKQHFFELDIDGQKQIEMREAFRISRNETEINPGAFSLCDTCTKNEDCTIAELGAAVAECSDYGAPN